LNVLVIRFAIAQERSVPELEVLMQQYAADVQLSAGAKYENGISELNRSYSSALDRALKAAQNKGDLEEALAFKNELALKELRQR
jgi:predicted secreted Zn-dependent protease